MVARNSRAAVQTAAVRRRMAVVVHEILKMGDDTAGALCRKYMLSFLSDENPTVATAMVDSLDVCFDLLAFRQKVLVRANCAVCLTYFLE